MQEILTPISRKILSSAVAAVLLLGIIISSERLRVIQVETGRVDEVFYIPEARFIKPLMLGHEAFVADLVWIRTLGYFADELLRGKKLKYLEELIEFATDLDPRFERIYIWAGAIYMYGGGSITKEKIQASTEILKKGWENIQNDPDGWRHLPNYWMIPQMIGFNYAMELKEREKGAPYIAAASRIPGSPQLLKTWAATLYRRSGSVGQAMAHLEDMLAVELLKSQLQNVQNEAVKAKIKERLHLYYSQKYGEDQIQERIKEMESRLLSSIRNWRENMPYVSFEMYLLLREDADSFQNSESLFDWKSAFPLMAGENSFDQLGHHHAQ